MIAHVPLTQPCLPARLGELQADAPASAVQCAEGGRPAGALIYMFETAHESSGCQETAHVPLAQPCLPARLERSCKLMLLQARCSAQKGANPLQLSFHAGALDLHVRSCP